MHRKIWGKYQNHYQLTEYKINNMYCMKNKTMEKINKLLYKHNIYKLIVFFCMQFVIQIALLLYCFRKGALRCPPVWLAGFWMVALNCDGCSLFNLCWLLGRTFFDFFKISILGKWFQVIGTRLYDLCSICASECHLQIQKISRKLKYLDFWNNLKWVSDNCMSIRKISRVFGHFSTFQYLSIHFCTFSPPMYQYRKYLSIKS